MILYNVTHYIVNKRRIGQQMLILSFFVLQITSFTTTKFLDFIELTNALVEQEYIFFRNLFLKDF